MWKSLFALAFAGAAVTTGSLRESVTAPPVETLSRAIAPQSRTVPFEPNRGQTSPEVEFLARCRGYIACLGSGAATTLRLSHAALRMEFAGTRRSVRGAALNPLPGRSNYFIGDDPSRWITDLPTCARVEYAGVLPGIDVVFRGSGRDLEYELVLAADADVAGVRLRFDGADSVALDDEGNVVVSVEDARLLMSAPRAYEEVAGRRRDVGTRFSVAADGEVSFVANRRTPGAALVIDPTLTLSASTYFGSTSVDTASGVATAASGIVVVGTTDSVGGFPTTTGALQRTKGDISSQYGDVFVTKFNGSGTTVLWSTYFGGNGNDTGNCLSLDANGNVYVAGFTSSTNLPIPPSPYVAYSTFGGGGYVAEIGANGNSLLASTYYPTANASAFLGIGQDASGSVYLLEPYPAVVKLNSTLSQQSWRQSTAGPFTARAMAVESGGAVWVGGRSNDPGFAAYATTGAYQTTFGGGAYDGFLYKVSTTGTRGYTTFLGGSSDDEIAAMTLDGSGSLVLTGTTQSTNFPTLNAAQTSSGGATDGFVAKFDSSNALLWSTYLGGSANDAPAAIATNVIGQIHVVGSTKSTNFPLQNASQTNNGGLADAFAVKYATDGTRLSSTYLGGNSDDLPSGVAVTWAGRIAVAGSTVSVSFPTLNPYQSSLVGTQNAFLSLIEESTHPFDDATTVAFPGATVNTTYSQTAPDSGGTAPRTYGFISGTVPNGLTFSGSGLLAGKPTATGTSSFTARITDADGATALRTYTVVTNPLPTITTTSLPAWTVTRPYSQQVAVGGGSAPFTWSLGTPTTIPSATSLSTAGLLSGTPDAAGSYDFAVQVQDANGAIATRSFNVAINALPQITSALPAWTTARPFKQTLEISGGTSPVTWSQLSGSLPIDTALGPAGTLDGHALAPGSYAFSVRATDAAGATADKSFAVTVNVPPQITTVTLPLAAASRPYGATVAVSGGTAPYAWAPVQFSLPSFLGIEAATGKFAGPVIDGGRYPAGVQVTDAAGAAFQRLYTLVVAPRVDLRRNHAAEALVLHASDTNDVVRYIELVAGTKLNVSLELKGKGVFPAELHLLDVHEQEVDLGAAKLVRKSGIVVRNFVVPATGRYFLVVHPTSGFDGTLRERVAVAATRNWSGSVHVDPAIGPVVVGVSAPAGSKMTVSVRPAKKSDAAPTITSVTDAAGTELLVPAEIRTTKKSATLRMRTALAGGNVSITIASRTSLAGDVLWTVFLDVPRTYDFTLPALPSGE